MKSAEQEIAEVKTRLTKYSKTINKLRQLKDIDPKINKKAESDQRAKDPASGSSNTEETLKTQLMEKNKKLAEAQSGRKKLAHCTGTGE